MSSNPELDYMPQHGRRRHERARSAQRTEKRTGRQRPDSLLRELRPGANAF